MRMVSTDWRDLLPNVSPESLLVVTDLDDTLLAPGGTLSQRSADALRLASAHRLPVVPASARAPRRLAAALGDVPTAVHAIAANGAILLRREASGWRIAAHRPLEAALVRDLSRDLREALPQIALGLEFIDRLCVEPELGEALQTDRESWVPEVSPDVATKMLCVVSGCGPADPAGRVRDVCRDRATVIRGTGQWCEILARGVNKGTALALLLRAPELANRTVIGIGDADNDIDMFAQCDIRLAVENASSALLASAHAVVPANSADGVSLIIEYLLTRFRPQAFAS
jgi:hydroxymethylpyrimidine pyrophosphatase-like HAD family hydrolase